MPTTETANSQIDEMKNNISRLENKLETLRCSSEVISADAKKTIMDKHAGFLKEYRYN